MDVDSLSGIIESDETFFLELNKSLDKAELKRTLLTHVLATNRTTTVNSLHPKKVA